MATVIVGGMAIVSQSLISKAISDLYTSIKRTHVKGFASILKEINIQSDIEIIDALLKETTEAETPEQPLRPVIKICICQIHDLIKKIQEEIEQVNLNIIEHHYSKYNYTTWFKSWINYFENPNPQPSTDEHIRNIKHYKHLLNERVETLILLKRN